MYSNKIWKFKIIVSDYSIDFMSRANIDLTQIHFRRTHVAADLNFEREH